MLIASSVLSLMWLDGVEAQKTTFDYYAAKAGADRNRLLTVEQYHIGPGLEKLHARNYPGALHDFEFVLDEYPNHPRALLLLLDLCLKGKWAECDLDTRFERAIEVNQTAAGTYTVRGFYFHKTGRLPAAIESYTRALALDPNSLNANYNLGLAYFDQKEYARANEVAQRAYSLGAPLPGLRDKLKSVGAWHLLETAPAASRDDAPSVAPPPPSK